MLVVGGGDGGATAGARTSASVIGRMAIPDSIACAFWS